jgi:DNA-directed RNA polymerase specialized sigma24 family protein
LLEALKAGDREAANQLCARYIPQIVKLARSRIADRYRRVRNEEDVALSAIDSFCRRAEQGHYPQLEDREDLWGLLATIALRKAANVVNSEKAQKRGGGEVVGEDLLQNAESSGGPAGGDLDQFQAAGLPPDELAQAAEAVSQLLDCLRDDSLRMTALLKLQGHTMKEIAEKLGVGLRSIERKMALIREIWTGEAGS